MHGANQAHALPHKTQFNESKPSQERPPLLPSWCGQRVCPEKSLDRQGLWISRHTSLVKCMFSDQPSTALS